MTTAPDKLDRRVMLPLFAVVAIDAVGMGVILPLLPFYSENFGANPFVIGVLIASFSLCQFIAAPWIGKLSDRYGRKRVLIASQMGTALSFVMLALAHNLWLVFAARILDGITSGNIAVAAAYAVDNSTARNRRQAIGVIGAAIGTGMMAGPALSAGLAHISIAAPVWGASVLSGLSILATTLFIKEQRHAANPNGKQGTQGAQQDSPGSDHPAADLQRSETRLLRQPGVLTVLAVMLGFYLAFGMFTSQFALFLNARFTWHGNPLGPREVGVAFTIAGAINIFVQLFAMKRVSKALAETPLAVVSLCVLGAGFAGVALATSIPVLVLTVVLTALGSAFTRPSLISSLTHTAPPHQRGAVMGLNVSVMATGNILGPLLAGVMINHHMYATWAFTLAASAGAAAAAIIILARCNRWPTAEAAYAPAMPRTADPSHGA